MPKVLIFGATGSIGGALAQSLRQSGNYTVYGIARSPEKARQLEALEIIPVAGSATDSSEYLALIRDEHIDVVVDAAQTLRDAHQIIKDVRAAGEERLRIAKAQNVPLAGAKLGFVYTSGTFVHGSVPLGRAHNDLDPVSAATAAEFVNWRVEIESAVLASSDVLDVAVARPGCVYGLRSKFFSIFFERLYESAQSNPLHDVTLLADAKSCISLVHVDDAGAGLHALVDRLPVLQGTGVWPVFDLISSIESLGMLIENAARAFGVQGKVVFQSPKGNPVATAVSTDIVVESGRAKILLGWSPKQVVMLSKIYTYVRAWKASKSI